MPVKTPVPWRQGEHLAIVGDTGTGKTTLAAALLDTQDYSISIRTKADRTKLPGRKVSTAKQIQNRDPKDRVFLLDPKYEHQREEVAACCELVWKEGGWTIYFDELYYLTQLGRPIEQHVNRLLTQGRSQGITVVTGMQRPVHVSRFALSQSNHVIVFAQEGRDAKTISEVTSERMRASAKLKPFHWLWFHRPSRRIFEGTVQDLEQKGGHTIDASLAHQR
jgi:ABC-type oligopeptide transport system ATPase subunit